MRLGDYLDANAMTQADFARRMGVSEGAVSKWVAGRATPRADMIGRIAADTGGAVAPADWFDVPTDEAAA